MGPEYLDWKLGDSHTNALQISAKDCLEYGTLNSRTWLSVKFHTLSKYPDLWTEGSNVSHFVSDLESGYRCIKKIAASTVELMLGCSQSCLDEPKCETYHQHPKYPSKPDSGTALSEAARSENNSGVVLSTASLMLISPLRTPNRRTHHICSRSPLQVAWLAAWVRGLKRFDVLNSRLPKKPKRTRPAVSSKP